MRETHFSVDNDESRVQNAENAMTSQDFIRAEAENTDRIILYKEGLFWKAYERSAYILCMQVRPFKPTKRSLKSLDGGQIVSVGFPWKHEEKHIGALERLESGDDRLTLAAASVIDPADFENWKTLLPLHIPAASRRASEAAAADLEPPCRVESTSLIVACTPDGSSLSETGRDTSDNKLPLPTERTADFTLTTACAVAERIRQFNLAESTPMECMLFISELKKTLQTTS